MTPIWQWCGSFSETGKKIWQCQIAFRVRRYANGHGCIWRDSFAKIPDPCGVEGCAEIATAMDAVCFRRRPVGVINGSYLSAGRELFQRPTPQAWAGITPQSRTGSPMEVGCVCQHKQRKPGECVPNQWIGCSHSFRVWMSHFIPSGSFGGDILIRSRL